MSYITNDSFRSMVQVLADPCSRAVGYKIDSPSDAYIEQVEKCTDDNIDNLMAYLQTLRWKI